VVIDQSCFSSMLVISPVG